MNKYLIMGLVALALGILLAFKGFSSPEIKYSCTLRLDADYYEYRGKLFTNLGTVLKYAMEEE